MNCSFLENYGFSITTTGRFISRALKTEVLISNTSLVGGFNPIEKIDQVGSFPQVGVKIKTV